VSPFNQKILHWLGESNHRFGQSARKLIGGKHQLCSSFWLIAHCCSFQSYSHASLCKSHLIVTYPHVWFMLQLPCKLSLSVKFVDTKCRSPMSHLYVLRCYTLSVYHCRLIFACNIVHLTGWPLIQPKDLAFQREYLHDTNCSKTPIYTKRVTIQPKDLATSFIAERAIIDLVCHPCNLSLPKFDQAPKGPSEIHCWCVVLKFVTRCAVWLSTIYILWILYCNQ
jgi:hypothetical protein